MEPPLALLRYFGFMGTGHGCRTGSGDNDLVCRHAEFQNVQGTGGQLELKLQSAICGNAAQAPVKKNRLRTGFFNQKSQGLAIQVADHSLTILFGFHFLQGQVQLTQRQDAGVGRWIEHRPFPPAVGERIAVQHGPVFGLD